jgi:hypothetical protein
LAGDKKMSDEEKIEKWFWENWEKEFTSKPTKIKVEIGADFPDGYCEDEIKITGYWEDGTTDYTGLGNVELFLAKKSL